VRGVKQMLYEKVTGIWRTLQVTTRELRRALLGNPHHCATAFLVWECLGSVRYDTQVSPEESIRHLCSSLAAEQNPEQLKLLLQQLEYAVSEYILDMQNRAVFLSNPSSAAD